MTWLILANVMNAISRAATAAALFAIRRAERAADELKWHAPK